MKIKILKTMLIGGNHTVKDTVVDVSDFDGNYLVNRQFAVKVEEAEEKAKAKAKK